MHGTAMAYIFNLNAGEEEAGGSLPVWGQLDLQKWILGQPGLLNREKQNKNKKKIGKRWIYYKFCFLEAKAF